MAKEPNRTKKKDHFDFSLSVFPFCNAGKVGDWKNMFTEEDSRKFETVFTSKMMENCTLEFVWE